MNKRIIKLNKVIFEFDDDRLLSVYDSSIGMDWISNKQNIYKINNQCIDTKLDIRTENEVIILSLCTENRTNISQEVCVDFLTLQLAPLEELKYCFPSLNPFISGENNSFSIDYSTYFPMQFLSAYCKGRCLTILGLDQLNLKKQYSFNKNSMGLELCTKYQYFVPPNTKMSIKTLLEINNGDWHHSLRLYQALWSKINACHRLTPDWLRKTFVFRQWFLHENYDEGIWDENSREYNCISKLEQEINKFGGLDYIQFFDWSSTPEEGRIGSYNPWGYLDDSLKLKNQFKFLWDKGIKIGLYFEGYLINRKSKIGIEHGEEWQIQKNHSPYSYAGEDYWTVCPGIPEWNKWLIEKIKQNVELLNPDGIYIDEYNCGNQYPCDSKLHDHVNGQNQLQMENSFLKRLHENVDASLAVMGEFFPADVNLRYFNASLTYGNDFVNLTRFVYPFIKQFVIIKCDEPIGDDIESIKKVFFNGQGIWLSGPCNDEKWFSRRVCNFIKKIWRIYKENQQFSSDICIPLRIYEEKGLCVNEFANEEGIIWTLYNRSNKRKRKKISCQKYFRGNVVKVIYDVWNERDIRINDNCFLIDMPPNGIGCFKIYLS